MTNAAAIPPGRVRHAFQGPESGAKVTVLVDAGADWIEVETIQGGERIRLAAGDPERLAMILARDDLTRDDGRPCVMINPGAGLAAFAAGVPVMPEIVHMVFVLHMGELRLPGHADGLTEALRKERRDGLTVEPQPGWWLLEVRRQRDEPPSG